MNATEEREIGERLRAFSDEARIGFEERSREVAMANVDLLFDGLEREKDLRAAMVRFVSELETEVRGLSFVLSIVFALLGVKDDDALVSDLVARFGR